MSTVEPTVEPVWLRKFNLWSSMQKQCTATRGPNGIYCAWEGRNCGYNHCPRRIFEEEVMPDTPPKPPQPKMRNQIKNLLTENKQQQEQIQDLTERLMQLEKKIE